MPRQKRQKLKQRADGRFRCMYHGIPFYGYSSDEALDARDEYKRQEQAGEYRLKNQTVKEYAESWLPRQKVGVSFKTMQEAKGLITKLTKAIGDLYIKEVLPSDIKNVYSTNFQGMSDSYIRAGAQLYRAMFDAAAEDGYCRTNPARQKSAKPHKGTTPESRAITEQERYWIENLCTDHRAHPAIMAMLYAGIRPQEAKALNIDRDIDTKADLVYVRETVHMINSNQYRATKDMKTKFSRREIPLFPPLKKALDGHHGMLVQSAEGKSVTVQAWKSVWESYKFSLETAINGCQERWYGKKKEHKGKKLPPFIHITFTPYDLRHSFCTMCRDNGVEINTCIHWMGHADSKMILKIYDEYSQDRSKKEAEKLTKKLFKGSEEGSKENPPSESPDISAQNPVQESGC